MDTAKVSIIIPTYNGSRYIAEAIESAINQTFKNLEIIIVDDGSTDNTKEIAKKYAQKDNRIKYFFKPNGGVGSACNLGIDNAQGDYIAYFEHDDISYPGRIEEQVKILEERREISLVYSPLEVFRDDSDKTIILNSNCPENADKNTLFKHLLFYNALYANPSIMFRKNITERIRYDETLPRGLGHDYLFFLRVSQEHKFFKIKKPLVRWRRGHGSLSAGPPCIESDKLVIKKLYEGELKSKIPYNYALSMLFVREGRVLVDLKHQKNRYFVFIKCLFKAFYYAPLNLAIYKTLLWLFTKRLIAKLSGA